MKHCTSCGAPIPDGQGKSCSMCYGDPNHGTDGYYQRYLEEQEYERQRQEQYDKDAEAQYYERQEGG